MLKLSYSTKAAFHKLLHPFKYGFWCKLCIVTADYYTKHPYLGMLWETWDSYAGDGDCGWDYRWTGNRKTWKGLKWYKKFGIDDEGFVFTVPFFIAYLLVLPGTLYNIYKQNEEMKHFEEYHRTHYFDEESMTWEEKK